MYCDQFVRLCVCLSVREHISGTAGPIVTKFFCAHLHVAVIRSSSGGVAIHYALPILWMTSRWAVMGLMAMRGRLNIQHTTTSGVAIPGPSLMSMNALFVLGNGKYIKNTLRLNKLYQL